MTLRILLLPFVATTALAAGADEMAMDDMSMGMSGMYGRYEMTREASGTAWQPESTPDDAHMYMGADWMWMLHGQVQLAYTDQGGKRGATDLYTPMMFMAMGSRPLDDGMLGIRVMLSPEAAPMGKDGYPLLLQTGESADGTTHLIDRQHPHDLFMELAASYSTALGADLDGFVYVGLPGEPALGPPVFMHRFSGEEFPAATITHHWMDSTHVTFGVVTFGLIDGGLKLEGSAFHGREPDAQRYDIEAGPLDSWSTRVSWNPDADWSLQASAGDIASPEALEPAIDVFRTTASVMHGTDRFGGYLQTTLAWGRNAPHGAGAGPALDAWLLESAWRRDARWTLLGRFEHAKKGELFNVGDPGGSPTDLFHVNAVSLGAIRELAAVGDGTLGLGLLWSRALVPAELEDDYGADPDSYTLFLRLRL